MKNIEVEARGKITKNEKDKLEKFFELNGKFKEEKNRILIDYSTFLPQEGIRERTKDIRLRVTNGIPEIIVKIGNWGGSENRKEISVLANRGDFDKLVQIFGTMGFTKGVLCVRQSKIYEYKNIEFALVEVPGHSYYFEAEKLVHDENEVKNARASIESVCKELDLRIISQEDFFEYIETLNREANEVFDYDENQEDYFKERFKL